MYYNVVTTYYVGAIELIFIKKNHQAREKREINIRFREKVLKKKSSTEKESYSINMKNNKNLIRTLIAMNSA